MKLKSLTANQPSFHPVVFKEGVNIIVGKNALPQGENDGKTYNGVGKSLVLHLIHFCLGSNKIKAFESLPNWEFTLTFEVNKTEYSVTRSTNEQNKVVFCNERISLENMRGKMLNLCFGITEPPKFMTWNTLFSRFVRRYRSSYSRFDTYIPQENDYSKLLNTLFLLGIETKFIIEKKELREQQSNIKATEKAIKSDSFFKEYYLGEYEGKNNLKKIENEIIKLKKEISEFKISNNYHDLEKEANDISYEKKQLENNRVLVNNNIKYIEDSLRETVLVNDDDVFRVYESAVIEIPELVKKNIEEVLTFHKNQIHSRNLRLKRELYKQQTELKSINEKITNIGERMDELLSYLNSRGALEEYVALVNKLSSLEYKFKRINDYEKILKTYREKNAEIKELFKLKDTETELYLKSIQSKVDKLREQFSGLTKQFYPNKKSTLNIVNNTGQNMLRYLLDVRIEDDSSDGVNEVKLACFDLLLLMIKKSKIRFLAHDSRLFANMDPRQRKTLFQIVYEAAFNSEFQYICSVNEDTLSSFENIMNDEEYNELIINNIILELTDIDAKSKLLGIEVDIELEGKFKN